MGRAPQDRRRCGSPDDDTPLPAYGGSVTDPTPPTALTVAGSDSGGGAGAQADLKTFAALRVHGTSALTAVTAQNTTGVRGIAALEPAFVRQQIETVLDDFAVRGVKTGMLATAGIVASWPTSPPVGSCPTSSWIPVLVSSTGHRLLEADGVDAYLHLLLPHALVVTPNLREAAVLGGTDVESLRALQARIAVAERIRATGARYVVIKGGHLTDSADDVVVGPEGILVLPGERVDTGNDHGTGCSLAAAVTAHLARGATVLESISQAKAFVARALAGGAAWRLGAGHGPLDHFGWSGPP